MRRQILHVVLLFFPIIVLAENDVVLDVAKYQIPFENVTKSALYALIKKDWAIETVARDHVVGTLIKRRNIKVKIEFKDDKRIVFRFVEGSTGNKKWLHYLRGDTLIGLTTCVP